MIKRYLMMIGMLLAVATPALAADNAGAFIEQGIGARAAAMGMAFVSVVGDSQSVYWNPANLVEVTEIDINGMATTAYETNFSNIQVAFPIGGFGIGVGYYGALTSGIQRTVLDELSPSGRFIASGDVFSYTASALFLSAGKAIDSRWYVGGSVKVLSEGLDANKSTGFGIDVATTYKLTKQLGVAAILQNAVQPQMKWDTASGNVDVVARNLKVGADYAILPNWIVAGDIDMRSSRPFKYHLGTEYWLSTMIPIRVGLDNITLNEGKQFELTLGTGIYLERLRMDLSWSNPQNDAVSDIWRFSLGYAFPSL